MEGILPFGKDSWSLIWRRSRGHTVIRHIRPRVPFYRAYGHAETSAMPILPVLLFSSASWLLPAAWPSGLVYRQAHSKMISDGRGTRCLRCQSRGILDAARNLSPQRRHDRNGSSVFLITLSQQQALLLASSDTVDTRGIHVRISSALA